MGYKIKDRSSLQIQSSTASKQKPANARTSSRKTDSGPNSGDFVANNDLAMSNRLQALRFDSVMSQNGSLFDTFADYGGYGVDGWKGVPKTNEIPGGAIRPFGGAGGGGTGGGGTGGGAGPGGRGLGGTAIDPGPGVTKRDPPVESNTTSTGRGPITNGVSSKPPAESNYSNDDFVTLQRSNKDVYLKNQHGLTSLYPAIISSHAVDNSLEVTKNFIDLNDLAKQVVEQEARKVINRQTSMNDSAYIESINRAKSYIDKMTAAQSYKDLLLTLLSPYTAITTGASTNIDVLFDNAPYEFLGGRSVANFLSSIYITPEFSNTHVLLTLVKNLVSLLQFVQPLAVSDAYWSDPAFTNSIATSGDLNGTTYYPYYDKLIPQDYRFDFSNPNDTLDMMTICSGDLVRQNYNQAALAKINDAVNTYFGLYGTLLGVGQTRTSSTSGEITYNVASVTEYITNNNESALGNLLIKQDDSQHKFSILEKNNKFSPDANKSGADYLIYDELSSELNNVTFDNLTQFANTYLRFSSEVGNFVKTVLPKTDDDRYRFIRETCAGLADYFTDARLTSGTAAQGYNSGLRLFMFLLASQDNIYATRLFSILCNRYEYKIKGKDVTSDTDFNAIIDIELFDSIFNARDLRSNSKSEYRTYLTNKSFNIGKYFSTVKTDCIIATKEGGTTSFDLFHNIARKIDGIYRFPTEDGRDTTSDSLGIDIHGRAYVIFSFFLDLLRTVRLIVNKSIREINDYIFSTDQFDDIVAVLTLVPYNFGIPAPQSMQIMYRDMYIRPYMDAANKVDQQCFDIATLMLQHAKQLNASVSALTTLTNVAKAALNDNGLKEKDTLLHSMQYEQILLKRYALSMYNKTSTDANYVPSSNDYTKGQTTNLKTFIDCGLIGTNNTKTNILTIGIPSGLIEDLRYRQTFSLSQLFNDPYSEGKFQIHLIFENMQTNQVTSDETPFNKIEKLYTFSTKLRVTEGSLDFNGADTKTNIITSKQTLLGNTTLLDVNSANPAQMRYNDAVSKFGSDTVENEIKSYYASLLLKSTIGLDTSEQNFHVIPQDVVYPDPNNVYYSMMEVDINNSYLTADPDSAIFATRIKQELARSRYCAPQQLFENIVTSKTFEKIVNVIIDVDNINELDPTSKISLENVRIEISLVD